ncbi:SulP family inorganic anion transporter [Acidocella sp.]|uniref:SulP family inorganic anion transporter n=1 Tax=Acidocella sp. TaxID=50710 RepID=UPI003D050FA4
MTKSSSFYRDWLAQPRVDFLSGLVVGLALIPEAIGFSVVAGVPPEVGLYASVVIATIIAFTGGRVAMISAATASTAVLMGPLVHAHGLSYLLAATILMGVFQVIAGLLKLGRLMRFVSQSVMTGFVNALAILIFMAQLPQIIGAPPAVFGLIALGLVVIYGFPYITKAFPAPLMAVIVVTIVSYFMHLHVKHVAELGALPDGLPKFAIPDVPPTLDMLRTIAPLALAMAAVGLLETMLTAQILDDKTDTPSNKSRECIGQGIANIGSALFGGMGGCAMIGQSVINVTSGGRGRLSTLVAGVFLLILLVLLHGLLAIVPVAALTAVMIMVSINTFSWRSIPNLRANPWPSSVVMVATVVTVVATGNLSKGVVVGVLLSGIFFAGKVSRLVQVRSTLSADEQTRTYIVEGQVFFASASFLNDKVDLLEDVKKLVLDVTHAHFWDISAVGALDRIVLKARRHGKQVEVIGLNEASETMVERFAAHRNGEALPTGH